jgi:uncharacterized protein YciI
MKVLAPAALLLVTLMLGMGSNVRADELPEVTSEKMTYLVIYRPGPGWLPGKPLAEQPLRDHGKYMLSLYVKGLMKLAGPLTDDAGGAVVLDVADEAEARAIVAADPAVKSGLFVHEMHPWKLMPWEKYANPSD